MVNVESLIRSRFIEILDRIGLPYRGEGNQARQQAFIRRNSQVSEKELSESTVRSRFLHANPMIALSPGKQAKSKHSKDKPDSGKEKKSHKRRREVEVLLISQFEKAAHNNGQPFPLGSTHAIRAGQRLIWTIFGWRKTIKIGGCRSAIGTDISAVEGDRHAPGWRGVLPSSK